MKTSKILSMLVIAFTCLLSYNVSFATAAVSASETRETILKKVATGDANSFKEEFAKTKMGKRAEKLMKKISKKFDGTSLDLNGEPDKWLKYAIIVGVASILLSILAAVGSIPFIGLFAWLTWLCAVVLFFYWLFKKLEII